MADTARGYWPKEICSDCGESGVVIFKHWGPLVPEGAVGYLCAFCWNEREKDCKEGKIPLPLGRKPFIEYCFIPEKLKVVTESNSVYRISKPHSNYRFGKTEVKKVKLPLSKRIRTVVKDNATLPFNLCRIICLKIGKPLYLIPVDGNKDIVSWMTTKVLVIEVEED